MMRMIFLAIACLFTFPIHSESTTIKYSSSCVVDQCDNGNQNGRCALSNICYRFETSKNKTLCAPQADCSLFDACTAAKTCASNASVCVVNSCCATPICMPLALSSACTRNGSSYSTYATPSIDNVCPSAIWSDVEEVAVNLSSIIILSWYYNNIQEFAIDSKNNYYVVDPNSHYIIKIPANNTAAYNVIGVVPSDCTSNKIFVDSNGVVYSAETRIVSNGYSTNTYYRVVKYMEGNDPNGTNGTLGIVLFADTTCGNSLTQLCACSGLFVDDQGSIYYSDSSNQRVVKIMPSSTNVTVVAGSTSWGGSWTNQLNNPNGIYVDANYTVYVADSSNYRVVMWPSGSSNGTVLFTVSSQHTPYQLTMDKSGNIYVSSNTNMYRFNRNSAYLKSIVSSWNYNMMSGGPKIQMDTAGNIYTTGGTNYYSPNYIWRYRFLSNGC